MTNTHIIADAIASGGASCQIVCTLQDGRTFQADLVNFDWCALPQRPCLYHIQHKLLLCTCN